jgi:crossover junction endodeoxyribonuclease RusA
MGPEHFFITKGGLMPRIELKLPWPPSVNSYWRNVGTRTLISKKGRCYKNEVLKVVAAHRQRNFIEDRLDVKILLNAPSRARRDIDNSLKAILDAMQHAGVYRDDSQIDRIEVVRGEVVKGGSATVSIWWE